MILLKNQKLANFAKIKWFNIKILYNFYNKGILPINSVILHKFWCKNCEKQANIKQNMEKLKMGGLLAEKLI